jgi:hypothetical protein
MNVFSTTGGCDEDQCDVPDRTARREDNALTAGACPR